MYVKTIRRVLLSLMLLSIPSLQAAEAATWLIIGSGLNVRDKPHKKGAKVGLLSIGTVVRDVPSTHADKADWIHIRARETGVSGWVNRAFVRPFDPAARGAAYLRLADERLAKKLGFADQVDLTNFLDRVRGQQEDPGEQLGLNLRYLRSLAKTVALVNQVFFDEWEKLPYRPWLETHGESGALVFSEPGGEWMVAPDLAWRTHARYHPLPGAEELAWFAAKLPSPGECEGFLSCYFSDLRYRELKYLLFYPNGAHADAALEVLAEMLSGNGWQMDAAERPDLLRLIAVTRTLVRGLSRADKQEVLAKLDTLHQRVMALKAEH